MSQPKNWSYLAHIIGDMTDDSQPIKILTPDDQVWLVEDIIIPPPDGTPYIQARAVFEGEHE